MNHPDSGPGEAPVSKHFTSDCKTARVIAWRSVICGLAALWLSGCATNPVTGESELSFVSEEEEIEIGDENYAPLRQAQGGDYVADKALTKYVNQVGQKVAKVSDRKLDYEFTVINSSVPNAWALPGGKIAINRGLLLELENEAELAAVLGHEVVHAAARHGAQNLTRGMLINAGTAAVVIGAQNTEYSDQAELMGYTAMVAGGLLNLKYGRDAEREADYYGMKYMREAGYDPQGAVTLQKKFVALSGNQESSWFDEMFASHPPSPERVKNNRKHAKELKKGGELGRKRYQQAIAHLQSVEPAYEAYEKGRQALAKNQPANAVKQARRAIKIEPNDNLFHQLLGEALEKQGKSDAALKSYNRAVKLAPKYYAAYEKRGLLKKKMGNEAGYQKDMKQASKLLPTAVSYLELGRIAEQSGDPNRALPFYQAAASAASSTGEVAAQDFKRLDSRQNPKRYLKGRAVLDSSGMLRVVLSSRGEHPMGDIIVTLRDKSGRQIGRYQHKKTLQPGKSVRLNTGLGPMSQDRFKKQGYRIEINRARVTS